MVVLKLGKRNDKYWSAKCQFKRTKHDSYSFYAVTGSDVNMNNFVL